MQQIELGKNVIMNTYARFPLVLEHGKGMHVWDASGKKYLDFASGIAVNCLGHGHEKLVKAISEQAEKMLHVSNLYWTTPQISFAERLVSNSPFSKVFFCNSGAEAVEAAIKLARKYGNGRTGVITMEQSFHGRTMGALSATGQPKYQQAFAPLVPGFKHVPFNDFDALNAAVTNDICAIIIEPIQGEGGIHPANLEYLKNVRKLCTDKDIVLIFDEIQCGIGRLGHLFAFEHFGIEPDVVAMAKGIAGGVPMGAIAANAKLADVFVPGDHASTFGGNPLATASANVILEELLSNGLLENVKRQSVYLTQKLEQLKANNKTVTDVRGLGLMQGIQLTAPAAEIVSACLEKGLLLVAAGQNIIRFVPPLIVTETDIDEMIEILESCI